MFYKQIFPDEIPIMDAFITYKCHCLISTIYKDCNGIIVRE